jgi:uncharacterized membrane protein YbhN (UPF0104 family)
MSRTKWLTLGAKVLLTAGLLVLILRGCDWPAVGRRLAAFSAGALAGLCALIAVQFIMLTLRWRWITLGMGYVLSLGDALRGQLISQFFNQGLPSSLGGDGVRVWWLTRGRVPLRQALENVLFDRLAGLFSLLLLALASVGLLLGMVGDRGPVWSLTLVVGTALAGLLAMLLLWRLRPAAGLAGGHGRLARLVGQGVGWLADFGRLMYQACRTPRGLVCIVGSSVGVHLLSVVLGFAVARGLGIPVTFVQCLAVIPPALLVAYLPLSIAGWGVREGALVVSFGLIGVPATDAVVVSLTLGLGYLVVALCGALVWLAGGFRKRVVNPA